MARRMSKIGSLPIKRHQSSVHPYIPFTMTILTFGCFLLLFDILCVPTINLIIIISPSHFLMFRRKCIQKEDRQMPTKPSTQIAQHTDTHFFVYFCCFDHHQCHHHWTLMILTYETYETMCILSQKVLNDDFILTEWRKP